MDKQAFVGVLELKCMFTRYNYLLGGEERFRRVIIMLMYLAAKGLNYSKIYLKAVPTKNVVFIS